MNLFFKMTLVALLMSGTLVSSARFLAESEPLQAEQLQGVIAREFLAREGILEQIPETLASTTVQGRNLEDPFSEVASDGEAGDFFGFSVALDGDTAVIGAIFSDVGSNDTQGAAYIFTRIGTIWVEQQKLVASDGAAFDFFGGSVALDGDTGVVGADLADVGGDSVQGVAYVFTRSGTIWEEQQKRAASDGAAVDTFGGSVTLSGDTAVVGAKGADVGGNINQGQCYFFENVSPTLKLVKTVTNDDKGSETSPDRQDQVLLALSAPFGGISVFTQYRKEE